MPASTRAPGVSPSVPATVHQEHGWLLCQAAPFSDPGEGAMPRT